MNRKFHSNLDRMALFTALVIAGVVLCWTDFIGLAITNIWLNGIIIGTSIFGIILCFVDIFALMPEYKWLTRYFSGRAKSGDLPPKLLRPVAIMLNRVRGQRRNYISAQTMTGFLDIITSRFEDQREVVRYISNTLIFLGLLGTIWGLIHTVGGFADLVGNLDFTDENVMTSVQSGLSRPLAGIGTAFASSLLGLGGSLIVGFLGMQVQNAQNSIFRELEENLSDKAKLFGYLEPGARGEETALPYVNAAAKELASAVNKLEKTVAKIKK